MNKKLVFFTFIVLGLLSACQDKKIYSKEELEASEELQNKIWQQEKCDDLTDLQIANNKNCQNIQDIRWYKKASNLRAPN